MAYAEQKSTFQDSMEGIRNKPRVQSVTEEYAQEMSREGVISGAREAPVFTFTSDHW